MDESKRTLLNTAVAELLSSQPYSCRIFKLPARGELFRHTDGGIYRFVGQARHTEDQSVLFLYEHVWPFEVSEIPWARPAEMWTSRFTRITQQDLVHAMREDRLRAQQAVTDAKAARRAAEADGQARALLSPSDVASDFHVMRATQSASDVNRTTVLAPTFVTPGGQPVRLNPFDVDPDNATQVLQASGVLNWPAKQAE